MFAEARIAWPTIELSVEVFAARLTALGGVEPRGGGTLRARDLYLAWACAEGLPAAHTAFEREVMSRVPAYLARFREGPEFVDEVTQLLRERLLTGSPPRIAAYGGRGPLAAWVRVAVVRVAVDRLRARSAPTATLDEAEALPALAAPGVEQLKARYRDDFQRALDGAIAGLTPRQRTLLRMYHLDGLSLDRLAAIYRVHRASVARWLAEAREEILRETHRLLGERFALSPSEVDSLAALVQSQLAISVSRLASSSGPAGDPR